jgi:hypothetical protein
MNRFFIAASICVIPSAMAAAQNDWTIESTDPGVTAYVGATEDFLTAGLPWDTDGNEACPPNGDDDIRCEWLADHINANAEHMANGVLATVMDGSSSQSAVFLSDVWADTNNTGAVWWVNYDVHYIAIDPSEMTTLRVTSRYQHAGVTRLTLNLNGLPDADRVQFRDAPTHFWTDTPETGNSWRVQLTLRRTQPGDPAMIWVDNIRVFEMPQVLYDENFSSLPGDFDHNGLHECVDVDDLVAEIVAGTHTSSFDLTGDGFVDAADLDEWLVQGGAANLPSGNPYLVGDANLDGTVDGLDFIEWNDHKFTSVAAWCSGDFNADGVIDGQDFILWNENKFTSSDGLSAVPEPGMGVILIAALIGLAVVRRR